MKSVIVILAIFLISCSEKNEPDLKESIQIDGTWTTSYSIGRIDYSITLELKQIGDSVAVVSQDLKHYQNGSVVNLGWTQTEGRLSNDELYIKFYTYMTNYMSYEGKISGDEWIADGYANSDPFSQVIFSRE